MPNKGWLLVVLVLLVVLGYFALTRDGGVTLPHSETTALPETVVSVQQPSNVSLSDEKPDDAVSDHQGISDQNSEPLIAPALMFSTDPVVDAHFTMKKYRLCYLLNNENYKFRVNQRMRGNQRQFFDDYAKHCQQLQQQNPSVAFDDYSSIQRLKEESKPTTLWGQIIAGEIEGTELSDLEIRDLLKQNDVTVLSDAPNYLSHYYQEVVHWDLEDVLQNRHYNYVNLIRSYAHHLYLCGIGQDCGPNGALMVRFCYANAEHCGLSFQQYHDDYLTPGQQADVALAMSYLGNQYQ